MKKIILITLAVIITAFGVYNIYWYQTYYKYYNQFSSGMESMSISKRYFIKSENGYEFFLASPSYLLSDANLSVSDKSDELEDTLLIWTDPNSTAIIYSYGAMEDGNPQSVTFDSNFDIIDARDSIQKKEMEEVFRKYYDKIIGSVDAANEFWGLDQK